jgi:hypothetical protein
MRVFPVPDHNSPHLSATPREPSAPAKEKLCGFSGGTLNLAGYHEGFCQEYLNYSAKHTLIDSNQR